MKKRFRERRVSQKLTLFHLGEPPEPLLNPTFPSPYPHRAPTVPPPYAFHASKVASRPSDWRFLECPRQLNRGVMSPSFRWLERGSGHGWQSLRKSDQLGEFKLHKLHRLNGLHRLHEADGSREGRRVRGLREGCRQRRPITGVNCADCIRCFISMVCAGVESE